LATGNFELPSEDITIDIFMRTPTTVYMELNIPTVVYFSGKKFEDLSKDEQGVSSEDGDRVSRRYEVSSIDSLETQSKNRSISEVASDA
jgi:hypothetical protein